MKIRAAVAGASGYAGGEVLRLLAEHPHVEVAAVAGHSTAGDMLITHQPHLRSLDHLRLEKISPETLSGYDLVVFALPHGASGALTAQLKDVKLAIDCGADHRLESAHDWAEYYGDGYCEPWTYGVPELPVVSEGGASVAAGGGVLKQRERLRGATRIAAPGCNASTVALSLAPGVHAGIIESEDLVATLAVGPSGAGKSTRVDLLASELMGSARPYAVGGTHRHIPEVIQCLRNAGATGRPSLTFTPVLVPMPRGILAVSTAKLCEGVTEEQVREVWCEMYQHDPFVHVLPAGVQPRTADTVGANTCLMSVEIDRKANRVVVTAAVDNLAKGTAGAAIQSMNIALGFEETTGLTVNAVAP